ncbi:hypothetical protein LPJ70_000676 [Coemansia sp. RSA 2708]|nr:hypothetical protein LPJ70_000676 [Coemansia sp. RSA 2708]KAJ2365020.1 hypothetical protein H4S01_003474 [Coemansia sp. RSA 2610]
MVLARSMLQTVPAQVGVRLQTTKVRKQPAVDPVQMRRELKRRDPGRGRQSVAQDISLEPTRVVRISNLPPGTTASDIRHSIGPHGSDTAKISSLHFEFDYQLRPLRSCRVLFFSQDDAARFALQINRSQFAGYRLRTDFVRRSVVPNPTRDKYVGSSLGRVVFLYGYPQHVHQYQIRDFYREYDIVDTTLPGVQQAPQLGDTFLVRRGAFLLHFTTEAEARRFVRDVYGSVYTSKGENSDEAAQEYTLKAILLQ